MSPRYTHLPDAIPKPPSGGCEATRLILDRVGDKWSLYIIATLSGGTRRFNELKREVDGISQRMLTLTLRGLERDGLVSRTVFPTIPPRVDYELTELGKTLLKPVMGLLKWAHENQTIIENARQRFDEEPEQEQVLIKGVVYQRR